MGSRPQTPWSRLKDHLPGFLADETDPVVGAWAVGQGPDAPDRQLLRTLLGCLAPASLLEVGCGAGIELGGLIGDGLDSRVDYTGYDFTPEMIDVCRTRFPGHRFEVRDMLRMDDDRVADVVVSRGVLEHMDDGLVGITNLFRAARTVTVLSWFMRPTWDDSKVGIVMAEGFIHHQYSMRELLGFVRSDLRPAAFHRFDFDHHVHPWSVWLLWKQPPPAGCVEAAHAYVASEAFTGAVMPPPAPPTE